jgi:hypothetical protein
MFTITKMRVSNQPTKDTDTGAQAPIITLALTDVLPVMRRVKLGAQCVFLLECRASQKAEGHNTRFIIAIISFASFLREVVI